MPEEGTFAKATSPRGLMHGVANTQNLLPTGAEVGPRQAGDATSGSDGAKRITRSTFFFFFFFFWPSLQHKDVPKPRTKPAPQQ